ncbi:MAG: YheU family protein [Bdellovibrionaceae bacterium]|nr:YheU family protein [Pseudobdellovibrionaceae bacterium]NUM57299.1 YheU family protein [Pseudobdellovibrionaceae bacterium]
MKEEKIQELPLEIPHQELSNEALYGIINSFILREGTDYGLKEASLEAKHQQIHQQILRGEVKIIYDQTTNSITLLNQRDWLKLNQIN